MLRPAPRRPRRPDTRSGLSQAAASARPLLSPAWSWRWRRGVGEDRRDDRHPRPQFAGQWVVGCDPQFDRDPLHDFGEIAGRIVRREQAELRAAGAMLSTIAVITTPGKVSTR